ncbi:MAG: MFS transporter [Bacteroidota bacterium]
MSLENQLSRKTSVVLISLIELLERFSYYGIRPLLVIFITTEENTGFSQEMGVGMLGIFTILIGILPLPMGILTDLVFKQEKGIIIGASLSLLGHLMIFIGNVYVISLGLLLIAFGSGLVKPSLSILMGRLFHKKEEKRNLAFVILFAGINLGALASIVSLGYLSEVIDWSYGFCLTALATFLYLLIFVRIKNRLKYRESNIEETVVFELEEDMAVLDRPPTKQVAYFSSYVLIFIITLVSVIYWRSYGIFSAYQIEFLAEFETLSLLGMTVGSYDLYVMNSYFTIPGTFIIIALWYFRGVGSTILKLSYGILMLGTASLFIWFTTAIAEDWVMWYSLIPALLIGVSEVIFPSVVAAYVTRLSSVEWSSTAYGSFLLLAFAFPKLLDWLMINGFGHQFMVFIVIAFVIGIALVVFKKQLLLLAKGVD